MPTPGGRGRGHIASSGRTRVGRGSRGGRGRNRNAPRQDGGGGPRPHFSARGGGDGGHVGSNGGRRSGAGGRGGRGRADETPSSKAQSAATTAEEKVRRMSDQDVLIAFGPHVRAGNAAATAIHREYLSHGRQPRFLQDARRLLVRREGALPHAATGTPTGAGTPLTEATGDGTPHSNGVSGGAKHDVAGSNGPGGGGVPSPPPGRRVPAAPPGGAGDFERGHPARLPPGLRLLPPHGTAPPIRPPPGMPPGLRPAPPTPATNGPAPAILPDSGPAPPPVPPARPPRVRRSQTRGREQPGRLSVNDTPAVEFRAAGGGTGAPDDVASLVVRPRAELTARWTLPLPHLRTRALRRHGERWDGAGVPRAAPRQLTVRDALRGLAVGLFRMGAADSGAPASIVSKGILAEDDDATPRPDYFFNVAPRTDAVFGTVPFYAPRTPGHVVFRLYFSDEPHVTLATGPCVHVVPAEADVDSVLRFVLSNFKSRKTNGISSMNSLATVLDLFDPSRPPKNGRNGEGGRHLDGAGRVAWGCVCEARKAVEQAGRAYAKKKTELRDKLEEGEATEEAEQVRRELPDLAALDVGDGAAMTDAGGDEGVHEEKHQHASEWKTKLTSEAKSNERKWREMQIVYASVLKVRATNEFGTCFVTNREIHGPTAHARYTHQ